jgi:ABC-2 type transport system ATP-binding protein
LVLDEPTSGLDPIFRQEFLDLLAEIIRDGEKAVFFSTHITTDLDQLADYILFIHRGEIVLSEEKETILSQYRLVKGPIQLLNSSVRKMFIGIRETDVGFEGLTKEWDQIGQQFNDTITVEVPSLEQMMVHMVKG